jgi:hypothetical protein
MCRKYYGEILCSFRENTVGAGVHEINRCKVPPRTSVEIGPNTSHARRRIDRSRGPCTSQTTTPSTDGPHVCMPWAGARWRGRSPCSCAAHGLRAHTAHTLCLGSGARAGGRICRIIAASASHATHSHVTSAHVLCRLVRVLELG